MSSPGRRAGLEEAALSIGLFVLALAVYAGAAVSTGPGAGEGARLHGVEAIADLLHRAADSARDAFARGSLDRAFGGVKAGAHLPAVLGGYLYAAVGQKLPSLGLASARLGHLALSALAIPLLYRLARPSFGQRAAMFAAAQLLFIPRLVHEAAMTSPDALAVPAWLLVLLPYARAQGRGRVAWGLATGLAFGLALGISTSALALLAVLPAHYALARWPSVRRSARAGKLPMPAPLVWMLVVGGPVFLATSPWLWFDTAPRLRDFALGVLSPAVSPTLYAGALVTALPAPASYAARFVAVTLPTVTVALAIAGGLALATRAAARRFAAPSLRPPRDRAALGALVAVGLVFTLVAPGFLPEPLAAFPPHAALAYPFVALAAGVGLDRAIPAMSRAMPTPLASQREGVSLALAALLLLVPVVETFRPAATASAAFAPLAGGPAGIARRDAFAIADPTVARQLAQGIDRLGRAEVSLFAPEIPAETWDLLRSAHQMKTVVRSAPSPAAADLVAVGAGTVGQASARALVATGRPSAAVAGAERDGVALVRVYRAR